jgi:hypothetical protein
VDADDELDETWDPEAPVEVPITDVIDLHSFQPREVADGVRVEAFGDAPAEAGGWGATWVTLGGGPANDPDRR